MGGCTAQFCNNSSKKGYSMKLFPTNPERRTLWIKNVGYKSHLIGKNSCLCEMHFAPDMWEQRADGMKKLKPNAVPTIFGFFLKKKISVAESANDKVLTKDNDIITNTPESLSIIDVRENQEDEKQCEEQLQVAVSSIYFGLSNFT